MRPLAKVTDLSDSEATRELMSLVDQAGTFERQEMLVAITGETELRLENTRAALMDFIARMPADERRRQVYLARRTVSQGMREYGAFDVDTDRRDMLVETLNELADSVFYLTAHRRRGGSPELLRRANMLCRDLLDEAFRKGAI